MTAMEPDAPDPEIISNERIPAGTKDWVINTYARLSQASALTEGVDLAQVQQLVTATLSITPTEHGIITTLSKRLIRRQGDSNVVGTAGELMGMGLQQRKANDVIALYDTLTKSIVGAGSPLDVTYFRGAVAYVMTDNNTAYGPAKPPFVAALHIEQISDIILDVSDPGTAAGNRPRGWGEEMLRSWWKARDRLYGVELFHSGYITRDTNDDAKGFLGSAKTFHIVIANDDNPTEEQDKSMRVIEYGLFQEWSEGLRADPHAVEVFSDAIATV